MPRKSRAQHIETAVERHNNKYDYQLLPDVIRTVDIVTIICDIHGRFNQRWNDHLQGRGCSKCGKQKISSGRRKGLDYFKKVCHNIHNNKYDYSKWNANTKRHDLVIIGCPIHGEFKQLLNSHISHSGCPPCRNITKGLSNKKSIDYFKTKAAKIHNNKYDYSLWKINYNTTDTIPVICPIHGKFEQLL